LVSDRPHRDAGPIILKLADEASSWSKGANALLFAGELRESP